MPGLGRGSVEFAAGLADAEVPSDGWSIRVALVLPSGDLMAGSLDVAEALPKHWLASTASSHVQNSPRPSSRRRFAGPANPQSDVRSRLRRPV
jgi:hypothetical protein